MPVDFGRRFDELSKQAEAIEASKKTRHNELLGVGTFVDQTALLNWQVKALHLISAVCGERSQHFIAFGKAGASAPYTTNYALFIKMNAVFNAAKEDYAGGYLHEIRDLIEARVFNNELEQAEELLASGYYVAAAVIGGVVIETRLRQLCEDKGIPSGKLDKMNADLAKADVYNRLTQKQITAIADIRNSAAHGETGRFELKDVKDMLRDVRNLLADRLS
jgi:hypothetical protein